MFSREFLKVDWTSAFGLGFGCGGLGIISGVLMVLFNQIQELYDA